MNVLLLYSYAVEQADRLGKLLSDRWQVSTHLDHEPVEDLAAKLAQADVLISPRFPAGLPPAPRLGLIQSPVAGYDRIDFSQLSEDCIVCNVFEHEIGVSEYTLLAMLEWQIRLSRIDQRFRAGSWQDGVAALGPTHGELFGKTIGIIGIGHIAQAIAARLAAFGTRIIGITRRPRVEAPFEWIGAMSELEQLLPQCDFVIAACPLTPETTDLLAARELALCKSDAVLINLARAPVVNEAALYQALLSRKIGGAILDVWYNNPGQPGDQIRPSNLPFNELDNVIMTPHCSSWSDGLLPRRWRIIADNLENFADGKALKNQISRKIV